MIERARASSESLWNGHLRSEFINTLMTGLHGEASVGGFPIAVRALPDGHRYVHHSGFYTYKFPPPVWGGTTVQPIEQVYSGDGHFQLSIMPSESKDVPIVAACLVQARQGYIYSPIERPEPYTVQLLPGEEHWHRREREMYSALTAAMSARLAAVATL